MESSCMHSFTNAKRKGSDNQSVKQGRYNCHLVSAAHVNIQKYHMLWLCSLVATLATWEEGKVVTRLMLSLCS